MTNTKKMVLLGILISQAVVLSVVERAIPIPVPIPGVKLGLANIVSIFTIAVFGIQETLTVVFLRVIISSIFGGGIAGFMYSIAGGILSAAIMSIMYNRFKDFSILSISVTGAIFHNIAQLITASIVVNDFRIFYYMPILMFSGIITGIIIGFIAKYTIEPIKKILNL